jgi:hypothetical protein
MAKRDSETTRANGGTNPADTMEQRVAGVPSSWGEIAGALAREGQRAGWTARR